MQPGQIIRDRRAELREARFVGIKDMPSLQGCGCGGSMKAGVGRSPSPYHSGMPCGSPIPSAETYAMRETGNSRMMFRTRIEKLLPC